MNRTPPVGGRTRHVLASARAGTRGADETASGTGTTAAVAAAPSSGTDGSTVRIFVDGALPVSAASALSLLAGTQPLPVGAGSPSPMVATDPAGWFTVDVARGA